MFAKLEFFCLTNEVNCLGTSWEGEAGVRIVLEQGFSKSWLGNGWAPDGASIDVRDDVHQIITRCGRYCTHGLGETVVWVWASEYF